MDAAEKREYMKTWRAAHPEKLAEYEANRPQRDWPAEYQRHQDYRRTYAIAYYWANREDRLKYCADRKHVSAAVRAAYKQTAIGKRRAVAHEAKRRALKLQSSATATSDEVERVLRAASCHVCRKRFTKSNPATLDHVIPLAKGGTHDVTNLAAAHGLCNLRKHARSENPFTGQALLL
jgi:5-methylcytosine-specific restriction endonuclease McrA